jgi:hypothetical protein
MTRLRRGKHPAPIGFGFRVTGFELTRNSKLETRNDSSFIAAEIGQAIDHLHQTPKGYVTF